MRGIIGFLCGVVLLVGGCASSVAGKDAADMAAWPPADQALVAAGEAMSSLQTLRERQSSRTYRDEQLYLALDAERAYVAPDRRWERVEGRSGGDSVAGETLQVANRFYKRLGDSAQWQKSDWPEGYAWPASDYRFPEAFNAGWAGSETIAGRPARILAFQHTGSVERRNAGWEFQTRLWLDPDTNLILQRVTTGTQQSAVPSQPAQRFEGTWTYTDHNGSIAISEPAPAGSAP